MPGKKQHQIEKKDCKLVRIILFFMLIDALNIVLQMVFNVDGGIISIIKLAMMGTFLIMLVDALLTLGMDCIIQFITVELLAVIPFLYSYCVGANYTIVLDWALHFLIYLMPLAFCARKINDSKLFYESFVRFRWVLLIVLSSFLIFMWKDTSNNMSFSYALLPIGLLSLNELINGRKKIVNAVLSCGIVLVILVSGSRGPLVWIAVFIIIKILDSANTPQKKIRNIIVLLVLCVGVYYAFYSLIDEMIRIIGEKGMYSRSLAYLVNGNFTKSDSRIVLWQIVIECIKEKPILGWGIGGATSIMNQAYPHSIILDPLLAFGLPIGIVVLMVLLRPCISMLWIKDKERRDVVLIFFGCGFLTLLLSNSVFSWFPYFIFLGFSRPRFIRLKFKTR